MARHSKWHKVRQFKGAIDAKRSASFTRFAREIVVAAREHGADPSTNVRLRVAMDRARKASMPRENIERAVLRGAGGGAEGRLDELRYEAYAPGGTALIIECLTDNRNRSASDVKHFLTKHGGTLASSGAVTYLFTHTGVIHVEGGFPADRHDELELACIDAGASDIFDEDEKAIVQCAPHDVARVADVLQKQGMIIESADVEWIPMIHIETDEAAGTELEELLAQLEDLDDVANVFTNAA